MRAEHGDHGRKSWPELRGATGKAGLTGGVGLSVTERSNGAGDRGAWERAVRASWAAALARRGAGCWAVHAGRERERERETGPAGLNGSCRSWWAELGWVF